ncbi:MAG: hypothetical protein ACJ8DC_18010 [Gemmatimonadales bacterium]
MPNIRSRPLRTRAAQSVVLMLLVTLAFSCHEDDLVTGPSAPIPRPSLAISDATHGGKRHFYFLPPLVSATSFTGVFDPALSPACCSKKARASRWPAGCACSTRMA